MTALHANGWHRAVRRAAVALTVLAAGCMNAGAQEAISVAVDFAKLLKLPPGTTTLVVGNPGVADVSIQRNQLMVVTGRSYGRTNLIALDAGGGVISESVIVVSNADQGSLVVQRGLDKESLVCNPNCAPSLQIGDGAGRFTALKSQIEGRETLAKGQGADTQNEKDKKE